MSSSMAKTCPKSATGPGRTKSLHNFKDFATSKTSQMDRLADMYLRQTRVPPL